MQKIMFNDRYRLTESVLTGRKTQTRRIIKFSPIDANYVNDEGWSIGGYVASEIINHYSRYNVGEVVAVARSYKDCGYGECAPIVSLDENGIAIFGSDAGSYNKMFVKADLDNVRRKSRSLSKCKKGSNNRLRRRKDVCREFESITNKRSDFQWKLAHELCRKYDYIFIEDLSLLGMTKLWGRKISDLAHAEFVAKLEYVARKYGVTIHKIDRFYPSSKTCECGYVNKSLSLKDREWVCPKCGKVNDRDLNAAENILRRGISELWSGSKTVSDTASCVCTQESNT